MTELVVKISDELAQRAQQAGLLNDRMIEALLEDAIRKQAGSRLRNLMQRLHQVDEPPLSNGELNAEIQAARTNR